MSAESLKREREAVETLIIWASVMDRQKAAREMPYDEYLQTEHWKDIREEAIERAGGRCAVCNSDGPLQGHHRTYENKGAERVGDVIALCGDCHKKFHGITDKEVPKPPF